MKKVNKKQMIDAILKKLCSYKDEDLVAFLKHLFKIILENDYSYKEILNIYNEYIIKND